MSDLNMMHHRLTTPSILATARANHWYTRVLVVAATVGAALVVWLIAKPLIGGAFTIPLAGGTQTIVVGWVSVIAITLVASLAAWGLLAMLERFTLHARAAWTAIAAVALLLSFAGPLFAASAASAGTKLSLALMHVVVAAVLIPLLARTTPSRPGVETIRQQASDDRRTA